jgi:hypothetical protein
MTVLACWNSWSVALAATKSDLSFTQWLAVYEIWQSVGPFDPALSMSKAISLLRNCF